MSKCVNYVNFTNNYVTHRFFNRHIFVLNLTENHFLIHVK